MQTPVEQAQVEDATNHFMLTQQEPSVEQAQVEDATNHFSEYGKPRCIPPILLDFWFCLQYNFTCSLSLEEFDDTIVAL
jgi:hypothetical protein